MAVFASLVVVQFTPSPPATGPQIRVQEIPAWGEGETLNEAVVNLRDAVLDYAAASGQGDALARLLLPGERG
jgi:hypothetical protein